MASSVGQTFEDPDGVVVAPDFDLDVVVGSSDHLGFVADDLDMLTRSQTDLGQDLVVMLVHQLLDLLIRLLGAAEAAAHLDFMMFSH